MGLGKDIYLDGVVCLVDAVYGQRVGAFCVTGTKEIDPLCSPANRRRLRQRGGGGERQVRSPGPGISVLDLLQFISDRWLVPT